MVLRVVIHEAEEGGFWAEVPALPGCLTQAETLADLRVRAREAIEGYLGIGDEPPLVEGEAIMEIAV
jgi:predicted RNase H-like HicB family nuclease